MAAQRISTGVKASKKPGAGGTPAVPGSYVVFARRFRPQSFAEVAGQSAVTGALRQALVSGRVAQAYLFCGPRGVGKTSLARILAKALNCLKGTGPGGMAQEPCNECDACRAIQEGSSLDVIEMDAATNRGIEEIRSLRENVGIAPAELRYKVYIIDEVHMLTKEAWNAFLKTLEEPPAHVKFVFATTDPNNVPETILSRCQRFDLRRIGPTDIIKRLKQICGLEKIECEEMALSRIASLARGGLRDAEGLLEQAVNLGDGKVTDAIVRELSGAAPDELLMELLTHCAEGRTAEALILSQRALDNGSDPEDMLALLIERLRGALLARVCGAESPLMEGQTHLKEAYVVLGKLLSQDQCLMLIQLFTAARRQMRDAAQTRLPLEMALIRAARAGELVDLEKLVGALEKSPLGAGGTSAPPAAHPPNREGARPNSPGRPAGTVELPPAATPKIQAPVSAGIQAANSGHPQGWSAVVTAVRSQKGGVFLASALSHAAVALNLDAGSLALGFRPEQAIYRKALEQPENQGALKAVLSEVFGRTLTITLDAAANGQFRAPQAANVRSAPKVEEPSCGEADEEFRDADALPLPSSVESNAGEDSAAPQSEDDAEMTIESTSSARPPLAFAAAPQNAPAKIRFDTKIAAAHPLVRMILSETGGVVLEVVHSTKQAAAGVQKT